MRRWKCAKKALPRYSRLDNGRGGDMEFKQDGDRLTITIDVGEGERPMSQSGKTRIVGSTHGLATLESGLKVNLNVTAEPTDERYS